MQGIAIKYITNILLHTHHSQESRGRAGHLYPALLFPPAQENLQNLLYLT